MSKSRLSIRSISNAEKEVIKADTFNGGLVTEYIKQLEGRSPLAMTQIGGEAELTPEQRARLPYVLAAHGRCVLNGRFMFCESEPFVINRWTIPPRLARGRRDNVIFFSLCRICLQLHDWRERVESELIARCKDQPTEPKVLQ